MLLHRRQQKHKSQLRRQLIDRAIEMRLEFARRGEIFGRIRRPLPRPFRFSRFPPPSLTRPIERQSKCDPHQPSPKPRPIPQSLEPLVSAQQSLLRHVLGIGRIPQHSSRHAKRQRTALGKPLLELDAQRGSRRSFRLGVAGPARSGCTGWLGQSQLPHQLVAEPLALASLYSYQTPPSQKWFAR